MMKMRKKMRMNCSYYWNYCLNCCSYYWMNSYLNYLNNCYLNLSLNWSCCC